MSRRLPARHRPRSAAIAVSLGLMVVATMLAAAPASAASSLASAQYRLQQFGCAPGPIDGRPGERTKAALIRFQAANRLSQSGRLDDITRAKLVKPTAVACDERPVPATSGTGRRIVLSQRQNWVWLIDANGRTVHQAGFIDNTSVLKPGRYTSGSKCGRPARIKTNRSYDGDLILQNFVRFAPCGVGFHRIPIQPSTGSQIHPDYLLGTDERRSSGCIRLSKATSDAIWAFTVSSTPVVVVADPR